jgi:hypothetical protein
MGKRKFVGYFVIYHIPGIKIGCTVNYRKRCKQYGVDELEIIELGLIGLRRCVCRRRGVGMGRLLRIPEETTLPAQLEQQPDD